MIFRKQKPEVTGEYFVLLKGASEPRIAWFDRGYGTFTTWTSGSITRRVAYWGDRIETPSVEIEEDESSATSSEPGDIAPFHRLDVNPT